MIVMYALEVILIMNIIVIKMNVEYALVKILIKMVF